MAVFSAFRRLHVALKLLIILLVLALMALIGLFVIAPSFVKTDVVISEIKSAIEASTGQEVRYDRVHVSVVPEPKIVIDNLTISNLAFASTNNFIKTQSIEIHFTFEEVFKENPQIKVVRLIKPVVELEILRDGRENWSFLYDKKSAGAFAFIKDAEIINGTIILNDHVSDYVEKVKDINGHIFGDAGMAGYEVDMQLREHPAHMRVDCDPNSFNNFMSFDAQCQVKIIQNQTTLDYDGRLLAQGAKGLVARGKVDLQSEDVRPFMDIAFSKGAKRFETYFPIGVPLTVQGEVYAGNHQLSLRLKQVQSNETKGAISLDMKPNGDNVDIQTQANFSMLDYDKIFKESASYAGGKDDIFVVEGGFNPKWFGKATIKAAQLKFNGDVMKNVSLLSDIADGEFIITKANATLPGNGDLRGVGRLKTNVGGLDFEGQMELDGKSFYDLLPMLGMAKDDLPPNVYNQYFARFTLIARAKTTTLSEFRMLVGDNMTIDDQHRLTATGDNIEVAGGISMYDEENKLEALVSLANIDFDKLEQHWRKGASVLRDPNEYLKTRNPFQFDWLKTMKKKIKLTLKLDNYTIFGMHGVQPSTTNVMVQPNQISIDDIDLLIEDSQVTGSIALRKEDKMRVPVVTSSINFTTLNLGDALMDHIYADKKTATLNDSIWSQERINFFPFQHFDGQFDFSVGDLTHKTFTASNVNVGCKVEDMVANCRDFSAEIWGGSIKGNAQIDAKVVPTIHFDFLTANSLVQDFIKTFTNYGNITGEATFSGKFDFSGLNFASWMERGTGHLGINSNNIFISQFNLAGVIRAVSSVRIVSGLVNSLRLALETGNTRLAGVEGNIFIHDGKMNASKLGITSNDVVGRIEGESDLLRWKYGMRVGFGMVTLAERNYPTLYLDFFGDMDKPEYKLDTQSVEAFVARKLQ